MKSKSAIIATAVSLVALVVLLIILGRQDVPPAAQKPPATQASPIRLGIVPDRDVFAVRKRSRALADYLEAKIGRPVELVTGSSYLTVLEDLKEGRSDLAVLGSLVTVLALDRLDARALLKTDLINGGSTYAGVICVPEESPVRDVDELAGKRVAMVRTTTAGDLFPLADFVRLDMMGNENPPKVVWVGTHDDAVLAMVSGVVDAAAVKDARLDVWMKEHPEKRIRVLARSAEVPESTVVARREVADTLGQQVAEVLLAMDKTPEGRDSLLKYGARRFMPVAHIEYRPVYDLIKQIGPAWEKMGIPGGPPVWREQEGGR